MQEKNKENNTDTVVARLTELDVREVSVVDRPANKRGFLIIKRDDGTLQVERMESTMPRVAIPREDAENFGVEKDAGNLVDTVVSAAEEEDVDIEVEEETTEPVAIVKVEKVIEVTKNALHKLMRIVLDSKESKFGASDLPKCVCEEIAGISKSLSELFERTKDSKTTTVKAISDVADGITAAVASLAEATNELKKLDQASNVIPPQVTTKIQNAVDVLDSVIGQFASDDAESQGTEASAKREDTCADPDVAAKASSVTNGSEALVKVGRKMKVARLSSFKKAVDMLQEILQELGMKNIEDKEQNVEKQCNADLPLVPQEQVTKVDEGDTQKELAMALAELAETIANVNKRLDSLEGTRPAGADADQPALVEKQVSMWANIFNQ
jgi:hypothetical protein